MSDVTQFQPPEGLFPHEAPLILGVRGHDLRIRIATTAMFEAASADRLKYVPESRSLVRQDIAVPSTPYVDGLVALLTRDAAGAKTFRAPFQDPVRLVRQRLAEVGWMDAEGKLTPVGEELKAYLEGYRTYLQTAMANRLHAASVEGREADEVAYAIALGIIDVANANRAYRMRLGVPIDSTHRRVYDFFGGTTSRQHDPKAGFDRYMRSFVMLWFIVAGILLTAYFLTHR